MDCLLWFVSQLSFHQPTQGDVIGSLKNYGEIVGFRNRADGDRWDVLVPGLPAQLPPGSRHRLSNVLGVILIKGGNHKLVVALEGNRPDAAAVKEEISTFIDTYAKSHPNVRRGIKILAEYGLSLDVWGHHNMLSKVIDAAKAVPDCTMIFPE